jgi:hypothetical protein
MRRLVACVFVVVAIAVGSRVPGVPWWLLVAAAAGGAVFAWKLGVCSHGVRLGLLPATTDLDGTPLPARWFCDKCGQTWPANFHKEHTPVPRFTGYDETKAVHAAKRASELADRQRALALQRAGLRPAAKRAKSTREPVHVAETADVVPIQGRRFVG